MGITSFSLDGRYESDERHGRSIPGARHLSSYMHDHTLPLSRATPTLRDIPFIL